MIRGHRGKHDVDLRHHGGPRAQATRLAGCGSGLVVALAALRVLWTVSVGGISPTAVPHRADELLLSLFGWLGVVLAGWLAMGSALGLLSLAPGAAGRLAAAAAERVTPLAVRKALTVVLGASVGSVALPSPVSAAGSATPAVTRTLGGQAVAQSGARHTDTSEASGRPAEAAGQPAEAAGQPADAATLPLVPAPRPGFEPTTREASSDVGQPGRLATPAFLPTAPVRPHAAERSRLLAPSPRASSTTHDLVTVRRGDTLWSIVRRYLGEGATDARVAREWPRWHAANRHLIGEDPDRILPGQQLRVPGTAQAPAPTRLGAPR